MGGWMARKDNDMTYILKDGRDRSFEIESNDLGEIKEYLGIDNPEWDAYDVKDYLQNENQGMDFYYLEIEE